MKWAREQKRALKTRYSWEALAISQSIFVKMSSDVDDGRNILTTSGVGKI